jgi:hypothetical protein
MAGRIRTLKPEILSEAQLASLPDFAWRLFLSLYALVDDPGRCPASPRFLNGQVFWGAQRKDSVVEKALRTLEQAGLIRTYCVQGTDYLEIVGWREKGSLTYQRIDKPGPDRFKGPASSDSTNPRRAVGDASASPPAGIGIRIGEQEKEPEMEVESEGEAEAAPSLMSAQWEPDKSEATKQAELQARERGVDLERELNTFRDDRIAKGLQRTDWSADYRNWLRKAYARVSHGVSSTTFAPRFDKRRSAFDIADEFFDELAVKGAAE